MGDRQMKIRLYADYAPWPLWGPGGGPLAEDELPVSDELRQRIRAWFNAYDSHPRPDWPIWVAPSGLSDDEEEVAWVAEGEAIRVRLANELGPGYVVEFRT